MKKTWVMFIQTHMNFTFENVEMKNEENLSLGRKLKAIKSFERYDIKPYFAKAQL